MPALPGWTSASLYAAKPEIPGHIVKCRTLKVAAFAFLSIHAATLAIARGLPDDCNPTTITDSEIRNFHKVDSDLYRGGRLTCGGLAKLQALGVRTFINLGGADGAIHGCESGAKSAGVRFVSFHISVLQTVLTGVSDGRLRSLFAFIEEAPKPVFVSCYLGRDRTGMIVALYRMKRRELSFKEAEQEAVHYGYRTRFIGLQKTLARYKDPRELDLLPAPSLTRAPLDSVCIPKAATTTIWRTENLF